MAGHVEPGGSQLTEYDGPFAVPTEERDAVGGEVDVAELEEVAGVSSLRSIRLAFVFGLVTATILSGLIGWLWLGEHRVVEAERQNGQFLQVGRQAAVNLTTIDAATVETDTDRIRNSATGKFLDDFSKRAPQLIDTVTQTQSKSTGTISDAALESVEGDHAQVLVAVKVRTSSAAAAEPQGSSWRMRIDVQRIGAEFKVADVQFVV